MFGLRLIDSLNILFVTFPRILFPLFLFQFKFQFSILWSMLPDLIQNPPHKFLNSDSCPALVCSSDLVSAFDVLPAIISVFIQNRCFSLSSDLFHCSFPSFILVLSEFKRDRARMNLWSRMSELSYDSRIVAH